MRGPRYNMCLLVIDPGLRLELLLLLVAVSAYTVHIYSGMRTDQKDECLTLLDQKLKCEVERRGHQRVEASCDLIRVVLQQRGWHHGTDALRLFYLAGRRQCPPFDDWIDTSDIGRTAAKRSFTALQELPDGEKLQDAFDESILFVEHLMTEAKLNWTRDVLEDVRISLSNARNGLKS